MQRLPKIIISTIPHKKQRYPTAGDYFKKKGELHITVSKMIPKHEFLVAIHEMIEWFLIEHRGITIDEIDRFDIEYENNRLKGDLSEPGDDPHAPYFKEHQFATHIEKQIARELGVNWEKYDREANSL